MQKAEYLRTVSSGTAFLLFELGWAYHLTGQHEKAVETQELGFNHRPEFAMGFEAHLQLAVSYIELDREEEARAEAAKVLRMSLNFSLEVWGKRVPYQDQALTERCMDALRKAGLR